jgi:CRISPR-associated protein Csy2
MSECPKFDHLLVVPRLRVQNANAISSPLTHGFPSMTAFLGLMWALERKTAATGLDLRFKAIGVVCHRHEEQITDGGFVQSFCLTRNPVGKDGTTAAIIEEGRIHLDISLIFALESDVLVHDPEVQEEEIAAQVREILLQMRIAGGSVIPSDAFPSRQRPYFLAFTGDDQAQAQLFKRLKYRLLPGFTLVARDDLLEARFQDLLQDDPDTSRMEAWLSLSRINWQSGEREGEMWRHDRKQLGWVVPIPVGYSVLDGPHPPGSVANTRDDKTPFYFVEGLYSVGQWLAPHRLQTPGQLLWYAAHGEDQDQDLYRCRNDYRLPLADSGEYDFD